MTCTGEPISWLRLEQFALGDADPAIAAHVAGCAACRHCLDHIRGDRVALPALVMPVHPASPVQSTSPGWRRWWLAPALAAAAAAAILVLVLRPAPPAPEVADRVAIKGVGEVALELVRERGGAIAFDAAHYAPGDRWKVVVSCAPDATGSLAIDVSVADGVTVDHPLPGARLACGNRVGVPGAFTVTGGRANRICARIATANDAATACLTVTPEPR